MQMKTETNQQTTNRSAACCRCLSQQQISDCLSLSRFPAKKKSIREQSEKEHLPPRVITSCPKALSATQRRDFIDDEQIQQNVHPVHIALPPSVNTANREHWVNKFQQVQIRQTTHHMCDKLQRRPIARW